MKSGNAGINSAAHVNVSHPLQGKPQAACTAVTAQLHCQTEGVWLLFLPVVHLG